MTSTVTRSRSNRAALRYRVTGDSQPESPADKSAATARLLSCQRGAESSGS